MNNTTCYTKPAPTPRELRRRLVESARKKQLLELRALRRRARQVTIGVVKGLGLRLRCARRPPNFLADVLAANPLWEADGICRLAFFYAAGTKAWQLELKRVRDLLKVHYEQAEASRTQQNSMRRTCSTSQY